MSPSSDAIGEGEQVSVSATLRQAIADAVLLSNDAVLITDPAGTVLFANKAAIQLLGFSLPGLLEKNIHDLLKPVPFEVGVTDDIDNLMELARDRPVEHTHQLDAIHRLGHRIHVETTMSIVVEADSEFLILIAKDLSEALKMEEELQFLRENFDHLIEHNQAGVIVVDPTGSVVFANSAAESLLQHPRSRLVGMDFGVPATDGEPVDIQLQSPERVVKHIEMRASQTEWNGTPAYLVMLNDVTHLKA